MKYKILTLNKKNIDNFADERNKLFKSSSSSWCFFLDSDELIPRVLEKEIQRLPNGLKKQSYVVKRKNFFLNQFVGTDKIIRLIRKDSGKWVRAVHEVFVPLGKSGVGVLKNCLVHNTADELSDYISKINKYSSLHAKENMKEGKKANITKIIFFPLAKFFLTFLKSKHLVFSIMASLHSFLSWSKQYLEEKRR